MHYHHRYFHKVSYIHISIGICRVYVHTLTRIDIICVRIIIIVRFILYVLYTCV